MLCCQTEWDYGVGDTSLCQLLGAAPRQHKPSVCSIQTGERNDLAELTLRWDQKSK